MPLSGNSVSVNANSIKDRTTLPVNREKWLDPDYKLNKDEVKQAKQEIKDFYKSDLQNGIRNGRVNINATPEEQAAAEETLALQDKISPMSAFASGMFNKIPSLVKLAGHGIADAAKGIVQSGSSDWITDEQKAQGVQNVENAAAPALKSLDETYDYATNRLKATKTQNPGMYTAGDFSGKALEYAAIGAGANAIGATEAIASGLGGGKVAEFAADQLIQNLTDLGADTAPAYAEAMADGELTEEEKNEIAAGIGQNALWNVGIPALGALGKGIGKGVGKLVNNLPSLFNRNTAEAAQEAVEAAAKSAPVDEVGENAIKQLEPVVEPEPIRELNPLDLAARDAEVEELAYRQQLEAPGRLDDFAEQIPVETPAQPVTDLVNRQTVENLADTVKPVNDVNRSELQGITDSIINARNTQDLVGNGYGKEGQEYLKNINTLQKQETNILKQAEKIDDPTVRQLVDEVNSTSEAYWNNVSQVNTPVNSDLINTHRQALENLDNYMKNMPENYGDTIRRSVKELEMPKETRKEITNRLKGMESYADRINNAATREELQSIVSDAEKMAGDTEALLKQSASTRMIKKGDFDEPTQAFVDALNGKKIYLSPEVRANFTDMKNINDFGNQLYFSGNGGRFKPAFRSTPQNASAIDQIFPEIDRETGYAISNFMKENGLNPNNAADQVSGLLEYGNYLKSNKDSLKVRPYEGGMFEDFLANVRKTADDKLNTFKEAATPEPLLKPNLQFFADKANDIQKQIDNMADGPEKDELRKALDEFWGKMYGAGTKDEAEEAWNALSKTRTNTMFKSGDFSDYELENVIPESIAKYVTEEETKPYNAAIDRMKSDYNGQLERFTKNYADDKEVRANLGNAEDINGMYLMAQDLTKRARATDDFGERVQLYAQARQVSRNLIKAERESGRSIQALAKFSRTPERMIQRAEALAEDFVDKSLSKDPNLKKGIEEVSDQINNFLKEVDADALKREEVEDMVNRAILMNKRLRSRLNKGDVQTITNAIMEERQYADIQKQLEFLSTGYRDIDGDTMEKVQDMFKEAQDLPFNSKKRVDLENDAFKLLATQISPNGGTFRDKIDAWRYLSMLANPTTHFKNMLGNFSFGKGMVSAKNNLAALIEGAADNVSKLAGKGGIDRTKAILNPAKDSALIKAAGEDGIENAFRELSGSHYFDAGKSIDNAIPAFNTKTPLGRFLNRAAEINEGLLSKEDEMAMMSKYKTSLAGYLKANGADASIFKATDDQSKQLLENGRQYAINQAKEAAFHQDTPFMSKISKLSEDLKNGSTKGEKIGGLALDTVIPFKKTPANILKSAFAYSPFDWLKVLTVDAKALKTGVDAAGHTYKAANFIDDISKAATGTGAFGIGYILAHEGILKIGSDLSDEEASFDKQTGRQNVSMTLKIPGIGDFYVPIQELMPSAAPLIFGGTVYETLKNKTDEDTAINTFGAGAGAIANGLIDMSMLSGISDMLKSVRGAQTDIETLINPAVDAVGNLASQMLPTIGRKANVTIDETKRSTYSDKKGISKTIDQEAKYLQTKIPGLQQLGEKLKESDIPALQKAGDRLALEPNIDVKGQVQESPGVAGFNNIFARAANNFLVSSLGNVTKDTSTKYDEERRRLEEATGTTEVLPYIGSKEAEIDGERLSPKDWTEYQQTRGQLREKLAEGIIDSPTYKDLSDEDKAALLVDADSFSKAYTQSKYGKEMKSENKKLAAIYEKDGVKGVIDSLNTKVQLDKYGLDNTDKNQERLAEFSADKMKDYAAYKEKESAYKNSNGIEDLKNTDRVAVLRKMPLSAQKELIPELFDSQTDKERWKAAGQDVTRYWKMYDAAQNKKAADEKAVQNTIKSAGIGDAEQTQKELASYGAIDSPKTVEYYAKAKNEIPSLTPKMYATNLSRIGGKDMKIKQDELLNYATKNRFSQDQMNTYWKAYGNWTTIPKLVKGVWKASKAKK